MDWSEISENALPVRRDDEPEDLRRNIADELADHLACAMQQERRRTDDEQTAKRAVLDRFGNPQKVAYQLWWDEMKEKIMSQRLTLAAAVIAAASCAAIVVLSWMTFQQSSEINLAILSKLDSLTVGQPVVAPQSLEWTDVMFRCVTEGDEGTPAEGVRIQLTGNLINPSGNVPISLTETTDSNGIAKFGPIRPGKFSFNAYSKSKQSTWGEIVALPGPSTTETVICPTGPLERATTGFDIIWPDALKDALKGQDIWVQCSFARTKSAVNLAGRYWSDIESFVVTLTPEGEILQGLGTLTPSLNFGGGMGFGGIFGSGLKATTVDLKTIKRTRQVEWSVGEYVLSTVVLLTHSPQPNDPTQEIVKAKSGHMLQQSQQHALELQAGQKNQWEIRLPMMKIPKELLPTEPLPTY